nr:hypothetical protein [Tanacetum cinerariifolium]
MSAKIEDQDLEISGLKAMVKFLEDKDNESAAPTQEDAPIKEGIMETGEEVGAEKSTELGSNDTEEMVNVLSSMEAANILTRGVAAASISPAAGVSTVCVPTSKALLPDADELASLSRDDRHKEAFPTVSSLDAGQDRENITKTSAMSHESSPWGIIDIRKELGANKSTEKGSNDSEEMVNVLSSMEPANILSSGGATFSTASVSPADVFPTAGVPTVSESFPTISAIFTTASVTTPYIRRSRGITIRSLQPIRILIISAKDKEKEKVTETEVLKKKKLQEQIDAHVAREIEEEFARENQRLSEQAARDSEIARIHAEEELKLMIEGLDRRNKVIAKHLSEYEQAEADLSVGEKIELISELVKYQDYLVKIH